MPRRSTKTNNIDPISLCCAVLNNVKEAADYYAIRGTNTKEIITEAWARLSPEQQERISLILSADNQQSPDLVASELLACETLIELQAVKSRYGESPGQTHLNFRHESEVISWRSSFPSEKKNKIDHDR